MAAERLRENYLNLLIYTLKQNLKKTSDLQLDDMVLTHFGMSIEESCFARNRNLGAYTKSITIARVNIEKYTNMSRLFPMIAETMQIENKENKKEKEKNVVDTSVDNNNVKRIISNDEHIQKVPAKRKKKYSVEDDVIIVSSDDDEESNSQPENDDDRINNNGNTDSKREILISVQTTPWSSISTGKGK